MLSLEDYKKCVGSHKTTLSVEIKESIWEISKKYEEWKNDQNSFDRMDVINYMINEVIKVYKNINFILSYKNYLFRGIIFFRIIHIPFLLMKYRTCNLH